MTMTPTSQQPPRVIKIGFVQDGKIIDEGILGEKEVATIGLDPANTYCITELKVARHELLVPTSSGYKLYFLEGMQGKICFEDEVLDLEELERKGLAHRKPKGFETLLPPTAKGKIVIGDSVILFQIVPPPPPMKHVELPKEMQFAGFMKNIDWTFATVLLITAVLEFSLLAYLHTIPISEFSIVAADASKIVELATNKDVIIEDDKETTEDNSKKVEGGGGGRKGGGGGGTKDEGVENKGMLALLTRSGSGTNLADILSESGLGNNITSAIGNISGVGVADKNSVLGMGTKGTGSGVGGGGSADVTSLLGGGVGKGGSLDTGAKKEQKVSFKFDTNPGGVSGKIDSSTVYSVIKGKVGGIRACYESVLKTDPNVKGTVKIIFVIGSDGGVSSCNVTSSTMNNTMIDECICRRVQRWTFPQPEEGTVTVSYTFIFTPVEGGG